MVALCRSGATQVVRIVSNLQHHVLHHRYTNIHGWDDDLETRGFLRISPHQDWKPRYRGQHVFVFALYAINAICLHMGRGAQWVSERQLLRGVQHDKGREGHAAAPADAELAVVQIAERLRQRVVAPAVDADEPSLRDNSQESKQAGANAEARESARHEKGVLRQDGRRRVGVRC